MTNQVITIFLASVFAEFQGLRTLLTREFASSPEKKSQYNLLNINSNSKGKPPILEYCLKEAKNADVFILLIGKTYPDRGAGPGGKSISHAEYEVALESKSVRRIFVFLTHNEYKNQGVYTSVSNPLMAKMLATVRENNHRKGHSVHTLPSNEEGLSSKYIYSHVTNTLKHDNDLFEQSTKERSVKDRLNEIKMQYIEKDNMDLEDALERLDGANTIAKLNFDARFVPKEAYPRKLYHLDDSKIKIYDFENQLMENKYGMVLSIVSPSGQGKSTFVSSFPERFGISRTDCVFLTGRELETRKYEQHILDVALVAKKYAAENNNRSLYLIVDALNECSITFLLDVVIWLQELKSISADSKWPIKILLTMRPDVANTVPELSSSLVIPRFTYDMDPFGKEEYMKCAASYKLLTPYENLPKAMKENLKDPLLLGMVGKTYEGKSVPLENTELDIFSNYLERLSRNHLITTESNKQILEESYEFAAQLLTFGSQTLNDVQLESFKGKLLIPELVSIGILTNISEQNSNTAVRGYGFRYDRIAEYCIGRFIEKKLHKHLIEFGLKSNENDFLAVIGAIPSDSNSFNINALSEIHWSGITLGLHFFLQDQYERQDKLLIELMRSTEVRWRMVARGVLVKLYRTKIWNGMKGSQKAFKFVSKKIIEYSEHNRNDREFQAELIRMGFEVIAAEHDANLSKKMERSEEIEMLLSPICKGIISTDQEIANLAISSLSLLFTHNEHILSIVTLLSQEIEKLDLGLFSLVRKQVNLRATSKMQSFLGKLKANRLISVPVFSVVKLLVLCFSSSLDENGRKATLKLLSLLLKRFRSSGIGGALRTTLGRQSAVFLLSTLLEIILRKNLMPINAVEWKELVNNPEQFDDFKNAVRLVNPNILNFEVDALIVQITKPAPSPFFYQTLLTALSTKFELANNDHANVDLTDKIVDIVKKLIDIDTGNGTAKYVASLVLYHINTFGEYGNFTTAKLMTELANDILKNHNGYFVGNKDKGEGEGEGETLYNSNIIGTTGRSLLKLSNRNIILDEDAFDFIRAHINKIKNDSDGKFSKYVIENLALLAILSPENLAIFKLIYHEIYWPVHKSPGALLEPLKKWVIDAFVRIRSVHPIAVDNFLATRKNTEMYYTVRSEHSRKVLNGDMQGLDGELVSWAFERIFFELVVQAKGFSARVNVSWCKYLNDSPKLKSDALVQLGLICMDEGLAWADEYL